MHKDIGEISSATLLEEMANFTFVSKYARHNEKEHRRETWSETVHRVRDQHLRKFKDLSRQDVDQIKWAFDMVEQKRVVPSMRSMQFGGKAIEAHEIRNYNCAVAHISSLRSFAEIFYLLLCGAGTGLGLSKFFLSRLPNLVDASDKTGTVITYVVEDNIEGWADSVEALLNCYFRNTPYTGRKIVFDYSRIRKKGTPLKTGGGKAPGYHGLKNAHLKIKALLDETIENKHHSRLKSIDAYDILMHCADAVLSGGIRRSATCVVFDKDDQDMMGAKTNFVVDKKGRFEYNEDTQKHDGYVIVNGKKYDVALTDWEMGILKDQGRVAWYHIHPQRGRSNNSVLLLRENVTKEEFASIIEKTKQWGEPGFVFADHPWQMFNPCFHPDTKISTEHGQIAISKMAEEGERVRVWADDRILPEYQVDLSQRSISLLAATKAIMTQKNAVVYEVRTEDGHSIKATMGHDFFTLSGRKKLSDLHVGDCLLVAGDKNGNTWEAPKRYSCISCIRLHGLSDVFCLKQPATNSVIANGIVTGQCFEIGFIPVTEDGVCGTQMCNLSSINGAKIKTFGDFMEASRAAAIIGTLQAAYTNFKYLSNASKKLTDDEALLGVSITGMMDNPSVLLSPEYQRMAAQVAVKTNEEWARKIGIKKAARVTCIKPEGTSSIVLCSASGIHPHHAKKYFRRIQCNKLDNVYRYFRKHNPHMCEESQHSANHTDDVITFPVVAPEGAITKSDLTALKHLEIIKNTQINWVLAGSTEANRKKITHNVSCTVVVKDSEWEQVIDYLFENRQYFAAVALISDMGDKMYKQAPMEKVCSEDEARWNDLISRYKVVDYKQLREDDDNTTLMQTVACAGGQCEVVDI